MEEQGGHTERLVQCLLSDFNMLQISHKHLLHASLSSKYNEYSEKQEQKQNRLLFLIRMTSPDVQGNKGMWPGKPKGHTTLAVLLRVYNCQVSS